jgi:hypothetical protein
MKMSTSIDWQYRPTSYFWAKGYGIGLTSDIKGVERRRLYEQALNAGSEIDPLMASPELDAASRASLGRLHPWFLGGEYLPNVRGTEVEIARIVIASTTQDVTSIYARPVGKRIAYRIVDEYDGETISGRSTRTSTRPLSLEALVQFFINGWELLTCLDANFESKGYDHTEVHDFIVEASSSFYPEFDKAISATINCWLDEIHEDHEMGDDQC